MTSSQPAKDWAKIDPTQRSKNSVGVPAAATRTVNSGVPVAVASSPACGGHRRPANRPRAVRPAERASGGGAAVLGGVGG